MKKILTLAFAGAATLAVASPAMAANVTINWQKPSQTTSQINTGESVTWNVVESGHNVNVYQGPETFKSTSGEDPKGTQFSHVFNTPGTYKFICDYHSSMTGTITVAKPAPQPAPQPQPSPQPQPGPQPQPAPKPGGSGGSSTGGSSSGAGTSAGPAGDTGSSSGSTSPSGTTGVAASVDPAAPALRVSISRARTLTVNAGKSGRVIVTARNVATRKVSRRTYRVNAGRNTLSLKRFLKAKRYRLSVVLVDAAGNRSGVV